MTQLTWLIEQVVYSNNQVWPCEMTELSWMNDHVELVN